MTFMKNPCSLVVQARGNEKGVAWDIKMESAVTVLFVQEGFDLEKTYSKQQMLHGTEWQIIKFRRAKEL